jgi:hypothetical protein
VHKTANILNKLPKSQQPRAKRMLQDIWMVETRNDAEAAIDAFVETYVVKYEKAAECLRKDRDPLLALLRLPGRTLEAPAHVESDRKHLRASDTGRSARRDASPTGPRSPWCSSWSKARRRPGVALRPQPVAKDHSRCEVYPRVRGHRQPRRPSIPNRRRLILQAITKNRR